MFTPIQQGVYRIPLSLVINSIGIAWDVISPWWWWSISLKLTRMDVVESVV